MIILETPAPPTRERLVLVSPGTIGHLASDGTFSVHAECARDATPDDLARGGYGSAPTSEAWKATAIKAESEALAAEGARAELAELLAAETQRAEKAERARDDLLGRINDAEEAARALRAELARLTALDRATDEELVDLYRKIYETHGGGTISVSHDDCRRAGVRTVAARVRQERCLVVQAVALAAGVTISRTSERVPGTTGMWDAYVTRRPDVPGEHYAHGVHAADVPSTLARLLGEVSRG